MGLRQPARVSGCAFTAVIANWVCALFATVEMDLVTNLGIGAAIVAAGAIPGLTRRWRSVRERRSAARGGAGSTLSEPTTIGPMDPATR